MGSEMCIRDRLKLEYPAIWRAGGNVKGNEQYRKLYPIALRDSQKPKNKTEERAIRLREAWVARHFEDGRQHRDEDTAVNLSTVAGIVAQIKWLAVGTLGERKMKAIIDELKDKLDKGATEQEIRMRGARTALWYGWLERTQKPQEKRLEPVSYTHLTLPTTPYV